MNDNTAATILAQQFPALTTEKTFPNYIKNIKTVHGDTLTITTHATPTLDPAHSEARLQTAQENMHDNDNTLAAYATPTALPGVDDLHHPEAWNITMTLPTLLTLLTGNN